MQQGEEEGEEEEEEEEEEVRWKVEGWRVTQIERDQSKTNLEDVGEVSQVEYVVEFDGSGQESGSHLLME